MIATTEIIDSKKTKLTIDFNDEGVALIGETEVVGDKGKALSYAHFFEQDLRRNNAELFPVVEMSAEGIPDEIGGVE